MSKREARSIAASGVDIDAPRAKRRKEAPATSPEVKQNAEAAHTNGQVEADAENPGDAVEDKEVVREKGLQVWQTLKDAVNKEGQIVSHPFLRLPSKRQYADYYDLIKRPVALDDIKSKLEAREYPSLEDVKHDFETCFRNAKRYNIKESQIFKDAKFLHKLTTKEFNRIYGRKDEDGEGGSEDEDKKKKAPTAYRLLKTRLQKVADKTDGQGRVLSSEFMELPNRKQWPLYYSIIKRPQCLENIFKKLKRKEYPKPSDFANDVELVFSNALEFNQEHTQIWEDAVTLRDYFRKVMSDLPEPFSIPAYTNVGEHPTKIRIKMPALRHSAPVPTPSLPSTNSITIPAPQANSSSSSAQHSTKQDVNLALPVPSPSLVNTVKSPVSPATTSLIAPAPAPVPSQTSSNATRTSALSPTPALSVLPTTAPQAQKQAHTSTLNPASFAQATTSASNGSIYHTSSVYHPPALAPAPPKAASNLISSPALLSGASLSAAVLPAPTPAVAVTRPSPPSATQYAHPLKHVVVTTLPLCRRLILDHAEGVKTWTMRLDGNETGAIVSDVVFLHSHEEDGDDTSGDEEPSANKQEEEEDEEEAPPPKRRGPGRPRKKAKTSAGSLKATKKSKGKASETRSGVLEVKHNQVAVTGNDRGMWEVQVPTGLSVLEVGEKGGMVWKVYLDRAIY